MGQIREMESQPSMAFNKNTLMKSHPIWNQQISEIVYTVDLHNCTSKCSNCISDFVYYPIETLHTQMNLVSF